MAVLGLKSPSYLRHKAATSGEMYVERRGRGVERLMFVIAAFAMGVGTIGVEFYSCRLDAQGAEVNLEVTGSPVGDAANVPGGAFAPCGDDIFSHFALQYTCLIPYRWYSGYKTCIFGFPVIVGR